MGAYFGLQQAAERAGTPPVVTLDDRYYLLYDAMIERFPQGAPSLRRCDALTVKGDVVFGREVVFEGSVVVENGGKGTQVIDDGTILRGED